MNAHVRSILVIESSGKVGRLGVARGSQLITEKSLDETRRHARDLAPAAAAMLRDADLTMRDVAGVFVSLGPGSYTGLRVGIMSAKALTYATGCALIGVPTFHAIAWKSRSIGMELEVIADALKGKLYVQRFARQIAAAPAEPVDALRIVDIGDWLANRNVNIGVTGPGLRLVAQHLPPETPTAALEQCEAAVAGILAVGWLRYVDGQRDDPFGLEPIYLRPSSAEEQWDRRP